MSYSNLVTINYMQMLLDLMEERQKWIEKRDESIREISRLSELVRATMNMIPADQIARYEPIFERIEKRPAGLSTAIRACYTGGTGFAAALRRDAEKGSAGKDQRKDGAGVAGREAEESKSETSDAWFTPVEIRDALKQMGFPFENYKANPLASIHTTLKRMVPAEMEVKTLKDGQKAYRLKSAGEWTEAFAEVRQWLQSSYSVMGSAGSVIAVKRNKKDPEQDSDKQTPAEGAKRGTSGGA
ncbi:MAG TPA: hypothetical protein VGQ61_16280 [Candidatus Angelobacter sp.]|nr:hypothetical protein [Candidatus Angelobacter sp.]